jgi:hypothetical protein
MTKSYNTSPPPDAAVAVPALSPRAQFVAGFVNARVKAWELTNNSESPERRRNQVAPSKEHLATWQEMGAQEAAKQGLKE